MPTPRNPRSGRRGERQDLRDRRAARRRRVHRRRRANVDTVEEYDPAADRWGAIRARMPTPRSALAGGAYNGRIYVTGGEGQTGTYMMTFRSLESYDPQANRWTVLSQHAGLASRTRRRSGGQTAFTW